MSDEPIPRAENVKILKLHQDAEQLLHGADGFLFDERAIDVPIYERTPLDVENVFITRDEIPGCTTIRVHKPELDTQRFWRDEAMYLHDDGTAYHIDITIDLTAEEAEVISRQADLFNVWYDEVDKADAAAIMKRHDAEEIINELTRMISMRWDHVEMAREMIVDAKSEEEISDAQELWTRLWENLQVDVFESKLLIAEAQKSGVGRLTPYINALKALTQNITEGIKVRCATLDRSMLITKEFEAIMILNPGSTLDDGTIQRFLTLLDKCKDY